MSRLVRAGQVVAITYNAYDNFDGLFIRVKIYEINTGTPVLVATLNMVHDQDGLYRANFVPAAGKTYSSKAQVYTDGTYTVLDGNRSSSDFPFQSAEINSSEGGGGGGGSSDGECFLVGTVYSDEIIQGVVFSDSEKPISGAVFGDDVIVGQIDSDNIIGSVDDDDIVAIVKEAC